jgi:serine/threonine-protein kinase
LKLSRFLLLLGGLLVCFMIGLAAFNYLVMPRLIHHNVVVTLPDLRGRSVADARAEMGRLGLQVVEERQVPDPTVPAGMIVRQSPRASSPIRSGRRVTVVTSSGPATVDIPDLAGLSRRQAEMTLQNRFLRVGRLLRLRQSGVSLPTVLYQYPPAGGRALKDQPVDLVVGEPDLPPAYRMPDLRGVPVWRARSVIEAAGCVMGTITYQRHTGVSPSEVLLQEPPPGSRVLRGATIELVASR